MKFGFETNVWTALLYSDIFPKINLNKITTVPFLGLAYWKHIADWAKWLGGTFIYNDDYFVNYREIDWGVGLPGTYLRHNYDGILPITININPGLAFSGEIELGGSVFTVPELTSDIVSVKIADMRGGECGDYDDYYSDGGPSEGEAHLTVLDPTISDVNQRIVDWLDGQELGWIRDGDVAYDPGATWQQAIRDLSYDGSTFPDTEISDTLTIDLPVHIQAEVTRFREYIDFAKGSLRYFVCCGDIMEPSVDDFTVERDLSVHVYNQFIHYDMEVEVDMFMTCQFEGEISQSFLEDPDLYISDMLWDESILGSHTVEIGLTTVQSWLSTLIWIIIIGVIIIVCYLIYRRLKAKKRSGGSTIIIKR